MDFSRRTVAHDVVLLIARVGLGVLVVGHAIVVYRYVGSLDGLVEAFRAGGVPFPAITAPLNLFGEIIGGIALLAGAAVRLVAALLALNMVGAWIFSHAKPLYSADGTGPELVIALGILCLLLVVNGAGRASVDHLLARRRAHGASLARDSGGPQPVGTHTH